ncbi:MAG: DEAD/DEAH box helicase [Cohaesibacter sp.]|nr:DEAD/DEAH box helicase [Cohaesibacter sp.]
MTLHDAVHPALGAALEKRGYESLTPVQNAVLDAEAGNRDLLVSAQTGSGKTVAFGLAMASTLLDGAERFGKASEPLALVIAPTRELAMQVKSELEWLYADCGAEVASCVGGMDMRKERRDLARGCNILVGTPGRLRDHIERGSLDMTWLRAAVLDEADEMLDLGFREDLEFILGAAPDQRQTLLFSATVPKQIAYLAKTYQRDALRISTAEERKQHSDIDYHAHLVSPKDKEKAVINVLRYYEAPSTMVFCSTREMVRHLTSRLSNRGFAVVSLSGELSQAERTHALQAMRDGRARVCVATDVAARGIDLPNLDLVIHADLPTNSETLLHRSGRTGRAGRKGNCVLVAPFNKRHVVNRLLKFANLRVNWGPVPSADDILAKDQERIFAHEALQISPEGEALEAAESLLALYDAHQVAAAFIASQQSLRPAPEEILDTGGSFEDRKGTQERSDFENGVWFRINAGRKHKAEPRWLLPMICRVGGFTKRKVGFIRILDAETVFELSPDVADKFQDVTETEGTGEKSLRIVKLAERPKEVSGPRGGGGGRPGGRGGPRGGKPGAGRGGPRGGGGGKFGDRDRKFDGPRGERKGGKGGKGGFKKEGSRKDGYKSKKPHRGKGE